MNHLNQRFWIIPILLPIIHLYTNHLHCAGNSHGQLGLGLPTTEKAFVGRPRPVLLEGQRAGEDVEVGYILFIVFHGF